jgi:hypothetical protein
VVRIEIPNCIKNWNPGVFDASTNLTFFRRVLDSPPPLNQSSSKPIVMDCSGNIVNFQHLVLCIYGYFSVNMWLQILPGGYNGITQIDYLGLQELPDITWINHFSNSMSTNFVVDISGNKRNNSQIVNSWNHWYYFALVHPSDAFLIASHVLRADPCRLVGSARDLVDEKSSLALSQLSMKYPSSIPETINPLDEDNSLCTSGRIFPEITIIQRKFSRLIKNLHPTTRTVSKFHQVLTSLYRAQGKCVPPQNYSSKVVSFEHLPFIEQARVMERTDILITAHGAAEANVVFMRPCGVVLEIFPYGYGWEFFYNPFFRTLQILHESWHDMTLDSKSMGKDCTEFLLNITSVEAESRNTSYMTLSHEFAQNHPGTESHRGRTCLRRQSVIINQTRLWEGLVWAVKARAQCLSTHPMFMVRDQRSADR